MIETCLSAGQLPCRMRSSLQRSGNRLLRSESGSELLEFAFSALILISMLFAIIDFSRAMYAFHFTAFAAQEAARYAAVRGAGWSSACSTAAPPSFTLNYGCTASSTDVQNYAHSLDIAPDSASATTVTTTWPGTCPASSCTACASKGNAKGCYVRVVVSYAFTYSLPFLPSVGPTFTSTSYQVIQY